MIRMSNQENKVGINEIYKMDDEIKLLQEAIHNYVDNIESNHHLHKLLKTIDKLAEELSLPKNNPELKLKLAYCIENTSISELLGHGTKHDILCCIAKKLKCPVHIPKENIYSKNDLLEFDPSKNGQNILKHGIDFRSIPSFADLENGDLLAYTKTEKGEPRLVYFLRMENKNVLVIVTEPHSSKCRGFRYISARYFPNEESSVEETIKEVIKDNSLEKEVLQRLRDEIYQVLERYKYTQKT